MGKRLSIYLASLLVALALVFATPVALADEPVGSILPGQRLWLGEESPALDETPGQGSTDAQPQTRTQDAAGTPNETSAQAAFVQNAFPALLEVEEEASLVQAGDAVEAKDVDVSLGEIQQDAIRSLAYPVLASKPDQLRARLHTQLTAMETRIDVRDLHIKRTDIDLKTLYAEVVNADPDLFFVTSGFTYQYYTNPDSATYNEIAYIRPAAITEKNIDGSVSRIVQSYAFTAEQVAKMRASYEKALAECLSWVPANATQPQAAKAVHDWLVAECSYNYPAAASNPATYGWGPWTSYGALVDCTPVCQGYALAFLAAMNRLGIQASFVTNRVIDEHGWNRVCIDGSWYNLDITFDDSDIYPRDHFFLRSDEWWRTNLDMSGYHRTWEPAGIAGTNKRYDGKQTWTVYTGPSSAPLSATSFKLAAGTSSQPATKVYLACDEALKLSLVQVSPADANTAQATWTSTNPAVATIDNAGHLSSGIVPGRATLTCTLGKATATLEVYVEAGSITDSIVKLAFNKSSFAYTGTQQRPTLSTALQHATTGDIALEEGIDYRIDWPRDCTKVGTKTFKVVGTGAFTGTRTFTYQILENDKSALKAAIKAASSPDSAIASANGSDVAKSRVWVPTKVHTALVSALGNAQAVLTDPNQTSAQIAAAAQALTKASKDFESSKRAGTKPATWKRLWGYGALGTMRTIVGESHTTAPVAILATKDGHWDALSASGLAGAYGAPILLTASKSLSTQTRSELSRLGVRKVIICGGPNAVSEGVARQISSMGITVDRVAGYNAAGTARAVYEALGSNCSSTCVVATSTTFQDALSVSPFAYATKAPIFLCNGQQLDAHTRAAIAAGGFKRIIIVGGSDAVSVNVERVLKSIAPVKRLWGYSCYGTSIAIANFTVKEAGFDTARAALATGRGYWDALAGTSLCGPTRTPLLLVDDGNLQALDSYLKPHRATIERGYVFGGTAAVSAATMSAAVKAAG